MKFKTILIKPKPDSCAAHQSTRNNPSSGWDSVICLPLSANILQHRNAALFRGPSIFSIDMWAPPNSYDKKNDNCPVAVIPDPDITEIWSTEPWAHGHLPPHFIQIHWLTFLDILLTDRRQQMSENITSLVEVNICSTIYQPHRRGWQPSIPSVMWVIFAVNKAANASGSLHVSEENIILCVSCWWWRDKERIFNSVSPKRYCIHFASLCLKACNYAPAPISLPPSYSHS